MRCLKNLSIQSWRLCNKRGINYLNKGDSGDKFYIIEEGQALATKNNEKGEPFIVKSYKKGDYFGELALIKGSPRAANVIAKVDNFFNLYLFFIGLFHFNILCKYFI